MLRRGSHLSARPWSCLACAPCFSVCLCCTPAPALAQPAAPAHAPIPAGSGIEHVTSVEGIDEFRLANGLQVLLVADDSKPTTTVNLTYRVGSRHEGYGETGMAHLLEHLLFKGTPNHPEVWSEFTKRGLAANGTTWLDRTNYTAQFSANDENLRWYLGWQADAMVNSFIARKDLDSEMTVVRNEMERGENNPGSMLFSRLLSTMFLWHNYGNSTIGARSDVENVDIPSLQAFYRRYYQPDNATLIISGKFRAGSRSSAGSATASARSSGPSARCPASTRSTRCRMANARSRCAGSAACRCCTPATTSSRPRTPTTQPSRCSIW